MVGTGGGTPLTVEHATAGRDRGARRGWTAARAGAWGRGAVGAGLPASAPRPTDPSTQRPDTPGPRAEARRKRAQPSPPPSGPQKALWPAAVPRRPPPPPRPPEPEPGYAPSATRSTAPPRRLPADAVDCPGTCTEALPPGGRCRLPWHLH